MCFYKRVLGNKYFQYSFLKELHMITSFQYTPKEPSIKYVLPSVTGFLLLSIIPSPYLLLTTNKTKSFKTIFFASHRSSQSYLALLPVSPASINKPVTRTDVYVLCNYVQTFYPNWSDNKKATQKIQLDNTHLPNNN